MDMNYKNIENVNGYSFFIRGPHLVLTHTLSSLLSADVDLISNPISKFKKKYDVDIMENPKRTSYRFDSDDCILLVSYAEVNDNLFLLGVVLTSPLLKYLDNGLFHNISTTITKCLCDASKKKFQNCMDTFGDPLITQLISKLLSVGYYNRSKIAHLINIFKSLRSTTFEGKNFSTGIILTKSINSYKSLSDDGLYLSLPSEQYFRLSDEVDRRFWFMANGIETFFITSLKDNIHAIYLYYGGNSYVSDSLLESRLAGGDVLLRALNGRELSIIDSKGCEFLYQECVWKYRNYNALKECLQKHIQLTDELFSSVMNYVLLSSRDDKSTILWIIKDEDRLFDFITNSKSNRVLRSKEGHLNIKTPSLAPIVNRILASDGATVINLDGDILYYGVFADLSQKPQSGVHGSGETAASILGQNGLAIKVSQDGPITIYVEGLNEPISF